MIPPRRTATPTTLSAPPKQKPPAPVLSVEEWESKAPLDDIQLSSINRIKRATEHPPLPLRFSDSEGLSTSRSSTPKLVGSRPGTPRLGLRQQQAGLLPKHPILTPQQFYDWYTLIERSVSHSQDAHFRAHVSMLTSHLDTCDYLLSQIELVENQVDGMFEGWKGVEESGKSLKESCERVLEERDSILRLEEELASRLEYFNELESATRMLNHPGETLVLQSDFLYMVERVDICIDYLKAHRQFREAELYLLRFNQCLTRAMTLIKMYFVGSLRALAGDVMKRLGSGEKTLETTHHLLYTRFLSLALSSPTSGQGHVLSLPPLLHELELRATNHPDTLGALLAECHAAYLSTRKALVGPVVREQVRELTRGVELGSAGNMDVVELTRAGCTYLKQLCNHEYELFKQFFDTGEDQFYQYLETLCDYLYDDLRPRILHEPRLTALCEVCTVLQALMVEVHDEEDEETQNASESKLHTSTLLQPILQDAQTRLFFKAQAVVQSDIRHYMPSKEKGDFDLNTEGYQTVKKCIWVLEQLADFVNPAIFQDIAEEAISLCNASLQSASDALAVESKSKLEGYLFLVRQLLVLREVPDRFGLSEPEPAPASTSMSRERSGSVWGTGGAGGALTSLLGVGGSMLVSFGVVDDGSGRGVRNVDGAKRTIHQSLRQACENVISAAVDEVCVPLRAFITSVNSPTPGAAPASIPDTDAAFKQLYEDTVKKIKVYVGEQEAGVLVKHTTERVTDEYAVFRHVVMSGEKGEGKVMDEVELRVWLKGV
ncbi:cis-golgi transport vesicle tethering complex subunit [Moniliophthora roreri MCA 2997]|uniref:Conserved oligomeric Golgi complex subunit 3 n=1 Tax=Moniliophthora roreri (strain MCA 2997) TaxID=1381753 RepID=V2WXY9_MONRO|nr:cis-golgi transport vesicle tethering complex subunit [Moniliophthora roreri MCA 2997]